ncbi:hypothetical protein HUJ05_012333 [Dendroctonus ponderosae]|nr:hypothetical protein HUJ05_012333 [Dendroctonus ponderosae]
MKFVKKIRSSYCREIVPIVQIANQARSSEESIHSSPATAEATKPGHRPKFIGSKLACLRIEQCLVMHKLARRGKQNNNQKQENFLTAVKDNVALDSAVSRSKTY